MPYGVWEGGLKITMFRFSGVFVMCVHRVCVQTTEFQVALGRHGLTSFMGDNAARQPGMLQEMMLHETAVAWIRWGLVQSLPRRPWEETVQAYARRVRDVVRGINETHDVEGLCRALPARIQLLIEAQGGKLAA